MLNEYLVYIDSFRNAPWTRAKHSDKNFLDIFHNALLSVVPLLPRPRRIPTSTVNAFSFIMNGVNTPSPEVSCVRQTSKTLQRSKSLARILSRTVGPTNIPLTQDDALRITSREHSINSTFSLNALQASSPGNGKDKKLSDKPVKRATHFSNASGEIRVDDPSARVGSDSRLCRYE